jgi:hypothetical protein
LKDTRFTIENPAPETSLGLGETAELRLAPAKSEKIEKLNSPRPIAENSQLASPIYLMSDRPGNESRSGKPYLVQQARTPASATGHRGLIYSV